MTQTGWRHSEETKRKISESKRREKNRAPLRPQLCACGCGEYATVDERRNRVSKYITGHNSKVAPPMRGKKHTDQAKVILAEKARRQAVQRNPGVVPMADRKGAYNSWQWMMSRCYNTWNASYPSYGARGITVCDRWHNPMNFLADMGERPQGMTLDRIDGEGNYEPGNCRWATKAQQDANRRDPGGWTKRRESQA